MLMSLPGSLKATVLVADFVCARDDEHFKAQLLSTAMFLSGACTMIQVTLGVR
jgi:hypothetical protein